MKQIREIFVVILIHLACAHCVPQCCHGENTAKSTRFCSSGAPINISGCNVRFIMEEADHTSVVTVDKDDNLILDGTHMAVANDYCFTKLEPAHKNVYVVCMSDELVQQDSQEVQISLNIVLQMISVIFIFFTVIVYLILPQMLDLQGISIIHSMTGLALAYIVLVVINLSTHLRPLMCHFLAYCVYTSFLYAFFWLNIICFHIWRQIINPYILASVKRWRLIYHIYGIMGPLLCMVVLLIIHYVDTPYFKSIHPGIGEVSCWFKSSRETFIYFYMPVIILISLNVVFFIWTSVVLWKQSKNCKKNKIMKYRVRMYVKLFFVMGVTWIFEVIQTVTDGHFRWLWYFLDAVNALEGLIIFLILVVFRKRVVRSLANKTIFNRIKLPSSWKYVEDSECEELDVEEELNCLESRDENIYTTEVQIK
ncbi:unnamed protein product [Phaedon cochleariae]|uniref:G-protein coupled receptors family 2 profile 2 domain-containing protein n=1 Tax=Phaedon cochleariae TaxID=80249 RepID=A0A9P0GVS3_PHACE|nr:unnamed protein product [Phaedon cochleariae]